MVVAHFFESGPATPVYVGAEVEERTANWAGAGLVSAGPAQGYIAAIDEKGLGGGPTVGSARASPGFPHSVSRALAPREDQLESRVREAQGRVILLERGLDRQPQLRPPGDRL